MPAPKLATTLVALALAACNGGSETTTEATATTGDTTGGTNTPTTTAPTTTAPTTGGGAATVVINEISSGGALAGPYMGRGDIIELYNLGDAQADLSGFRLSDDPLLPADKTYVFPDNSVIPPGGWIALTELDDVTMDGNFPFGLSQNSEETVVLADGGGNVVDSVTFEGADAIVSYCRVPDGDGAWVKCDQTFEAANAPASNTCGDGVLFPPEQCDGAELDGQTCESLKFMSGTLACRPDCQRDTTGCVSGSDVVINELEATTDQIELYNAGAAAIDIAGWILTDGVSGPGYDPLKDDEKLTFDDPTSIPAGGFLLVPKGTLAGQHPFGLGGEGDTVTLLRADLTVADQVTYGAGEADVSYCRLPDGPDGAWSSTCKSTFGAANM
jgi:hypothetical protein